MPLPMTHEGRALVALTDAEFDAMERAGRDVLVETARECRAELTDLWDRVMSEVFQVEALIREGQYTHLLPRDALYQWDQAAGALREHAKRPALYGCARATSALRVCYERLADIDYVPTGLLDVVYQEQGQAAPGPAPGSTPGRGTSEEVGIGERGREGGLKVGWVVGGVSVGLAVLLLWWAVR